MLMMISEIAGNTGMRIKNRFFTSDLSDRAAERISEVLADFLHGAGTDGKTADTIRLFIGSILAQCRGFFGEAQKISVFFGRKEAPAQPKTDKAVRSLFCVFKEGF